MSREGTFCEVDSVRHFHLVGQQTEFSRVAADSSRRMHAALRCDIGLPGIAGLGFSGGDSIQISGPPFARRRREQTSAIEHAAEPPEVAPR